MNVFFNKCFNVIKLDFNKFDTYNVTDMHHMFIYCQKLKEIKRINKFNTNKVTKMRAMLNNSKELEYLDLSNFDTSNIADITARCS